MSVHFDPDRKKWRAQIDGFPVRPKKRSVRTETKHEAQIEEHKLRAERDRLLNEAKQGKIFEKLDEYSTSENRFTLGYWITYTIKNHWRDPSKTQAKNVTTVAKRMGFDTDIRRIDKNWQSDYANLCRNKHNNKDQTIKCHLEALRTVLGQAHEEEVIAKIPKKPTLQGTQKINFVPRPEWVEQLKIEIAKHSCRRASKAEALPILVDFLRLVGCRVNEALQLDWADIQLSNVNFKGEPDPVIWFKHAPDEEKTIKSKRTYKVEIWSELEPLLLELKKIHPVKPFPFDYWFFRYHFNEARDLVVEKLGLDESVKKEWTIHRLRALSCTEKANDGWNCWQIMAWHNHSDVKISQGYVTDSEEAAQQRRSLMESRTRS